MYHSLTAKVISSTANIKAIKIITSKLQYYCKRLYTYLKCYNMILHILQYPLARILCNGFWLFHGFVFCVEA